MIHLLRLSLRNLTRNGKRNLATGSAIALGFAGIMMLGGYSYNVGNYLRVYTVFVSHTGHLAIFAPDGLRKSPINPRRHSLTPADQLKIEQVLRSERSVAFFEAQLRGTGLVGNGCTSLPFLAQGVDPAVDRRLRAHPELPRWMPNLRFFTRGRGIGEYAPELGALILSGGLARALGKTRVHDEIPPGGAAAPLTCDEHAPRERFAADANVQLLSGTWGGGMGAVDAEVTGLFSTGFVEGDKLALVTSRARLQALYDTPNVERYAVWLEDPSRIEEVAARLGARLNTPDRALELVRWDESRLSPYYAGTMQFLATLVGFVTVVLTTVIGLSVLNATTITVLERSDEIGMYRAFGFRRRQVLGLFVQESFWLCLVGLAAGALIGLGVIGLVNRAGIVYHPPGLAGGMRLRLVPDPVFSVKAALGILLVALTAAQVAASGRLRSGVADLLGGVKR
jgi:putative ABC transport system permease protein